MRLVKYIGPIDLVEDLLEKERREREGGYARYAPCYHGSEAQLWRLWVKTGAPMPDYHPPLADGKPIPRGTYEYMNTSDNSCILQRWQLEFTSETRPFMDGTLKTWPDFAP